MVSLLKAGVLQAKLRMRFFELLMPSTEFFYSDMLVATGLVVFSLSLEVSPSIWLTMEDSDSYDPNRMAYENFLMSIAERLGMK